MTEPSKAKVLGGAETNRPTKTVPSDSGSSDQLQLRTINQDQGFSQEQQPSDPAASVPALSSPRGHLSPSFGFVLPQLTGVGMQESIPSPRTPVHANTAVALSPPMAPKKNSATLRRRPTGEDESDNSGVSRKLTFP